MSADEFSNESARELIRSFPKERRLHLNEMVDSKESRKLISSITSLSSTEDPILLTISSGGGGFWEGHYIHDAIRVCPAPITGLVVGAAASVSCVILQACKPRVITRHSRILVHPPSFSGSVEFNVHSDNERTLREMRMWHEEYEKNVRRTEDLFLKYCKLNRRSLRTLMEREIYLESDEALRMGFVDQVV